jgi:hypothetical protein
MINSFFRGLNRPGEQSFQGAREFAANGQVFRVLLYPG